MKHTRLSVRLIALAAGCAAIATPAQAQYVQPQAPTPPPNAQPEAPTAPTDTPAEAPAAPADEQPQPTETEAAPETSTEVAAEEDAQQSGTDIFAFKIVGDARFILSNGEESWVDRGFGKTRFAGTDDHGNYRIKALPIEATVAWLPRFTNSLSANVSATWQRDQQHPVDLLEAFVSFYPPQRGTIGFSARAGLMWPEISLEHSTGGAWSVVNTITPSAINSWIGEEVKLIGAEATLHASLGEHQLSATGAVFGYNDTSGTLLSFRGWALHDLKATAWGHFPLPPLNEFMTHAQEDRTRSLIELDDKVGFYGRLDWRPPWPFGAALFYYDNRGDPEVFNDDLQWGWRTRFWNLGINADLGPNTRLLSQAMTGTTIMGFETNGERWVRTRFRSAYALVAHQLTDDTAVTGRIELFRTRERGSEMSPDESEKGWSWTAAIRHSLSDQLMLFVEAMNVRSRREVRERIGRDPFQAQTVFQAALRFTL